MNWLKLVIAIFVSELAGVIGAIFTAPAIPTWYAALNKPGFTPPSAVFAPVWTLLFLLIGIAAYLVWNEGFGKREVRIALGIFLLQLGLNVFWTYLFFGLQNPLAGFAEIIFLWLAILATIIAFSRVSTLAALLLVPYILWVSLAATLNYFIVALN